MYRLSRHVLCNEVTFFFIVTNAMTSITMEVFGVNKPNQNYANTKCGRAGCALLSTQAKYLPIHSFKVVVWRSLGNTIGGTTGGLDAGCIVLVVGSEWGTRNAGTYRNAAAASQRQTVGAAAATQRCTELLPP